MRLPALLLSSLACLAACNDGSDDSTFGSNGANPPAETGTTGGSSSGPATGSGEQPTSDDGGEGTGGASTGDASATTTAATSASTTGAPDTGDDTTGGGMSLGDCSMWATPMDFHAYVNGERQGYAPHQRWKGLPWTGEGHTNVTFSLTFTWDDDLAAQAQAEAEALVGGATPAGTMEIGGNGLCTSDPMWFDGLNTADWRLSLFENQSSWVKPNDSCPEPFAVYAQNPDARMGLFYHDFGGDGPAIHRVGVGAAFDETCQVWWVLQFGA